MPRDPDSEDKALVDGLLAVRTEARLLGELRRGLVDEGFTEDEVAGLCEAYLINAICPPGDEDD